MKATHKILQLAGGEDAVTRTAALLAGDYIPCEITWVTSPEAFESALQGGIRFDLLLLDFDGDHVGLKAASRLHAGVPVILLCGDAAEDRALEALRLGATDFVPRSRPARLPSMVRRALAEARDVAARLEAEAANTRLSSLLRAIMDSTSEGILVADLAGRITTYNRKFMSLCGIPEYILATMEMEKVLQFLLDHFTDAEAFMDEVHHLGTQSERETMGMLKSLGDRLIEGSGRLYRMGGETVGRVFSFRDVTDRERSAERLKVLISNQRPFLEAADDAGIVLWHETEGVLAFSETATQLLGLGPAELPRTLEAALALLHPEDAPVLKAALANTADEDKHVRMRTAANGWIRTRWTWRRDASGRRSGAFRDVSSTFRAQQELEAQVRAGWMTALASNFARAFRPSLETLRIHLGALADAGPEGRARHLDGARVCMDELTSLLDEAARAGMGEPAPDLLLDLNAMVERLRPWAEEAAGPQVALTFDLAPDLPTLPVNPARMEPVVMNLVRNAREALDGQGEIQVRTRLEAPDPATAGPARLVLEVKDNGPGISPRVKDQMFDPYFTTRAEAKGLGLTVVRCLVESFGGAIRVDTEPMRGTSVKISLPC